MRQQSKVQVIVRGSVIGGPKPLICLPLLAASRVDLLQQAEELVAMQPDLLEWRVDAYGQVENVDECLGDLRRLRRIIGGIPLIFTCRINREGGLSKISQEKRLALIIAAVASGDIDLVDIELSNEKDFTDFVREKAKAHNCKLIFSHHNFKETPSEAFIMGKLLEGQSAGADVTKLAVMPKNYADVLTLLSATNRSRNGAVTIPIVTMAMGPEGAITRLAGGLFGSDITFAIGRQSSAPGQIPIKDLRAGMTLLYGE